MWLNKHSVSIDTTKLTKTIRVLPEESTIQFILSGQENISEVMADLLIPINGVSFTINSFWVNTISEDDLNWGDNGEAVVVNFYQAKNNIEYRNSAKAAQESLFFLTEFLFPYQEGMNSLIATGLVADDPDKNNSITLKGHFRFIKIAVFFDKQEDASIVTIIYTLINEQ